MSVSVMIHKSDDHVCVMVASGVTELYHEHLTSVAEGESFFSGQVGELLGRSAEGAGQSWPEVRGLVMKELERIDARAEEFGKEVTKEWITGS